MVLMLLTIATFLVVSGMVMAAYYAATAETAVQRRVRSLVPSGVADAQTLSPTRQGPSAVQRTLAGLGRYGIGGGERSLRQKLSVAGFRGPNAPYVFVGVRTLISFAPALAIVLPAVSQGKPLARSLLAAVFVWACGHQLSNSWLRIRGKSRVRQITDALPDTLDLMVTCLESGLGLNATIARIGEERAGVDDALGREFSQVSIELRSGRTREDALRSLGNRNGAEDLKALAALVIQSDRLGASLGKTLRAHADLLRTKRRQRAEEQARKLPIKMLFPLALFILPALFIVVGGPAILRIGDLITMLTHG
jgi:tight adherence protein C